MSQHYRMEQDGKWVEINFRDLKAGDVFQMCRPTVTDVQASYKAVSDAYAPLPNDDWQGHFRIKVERELTEGL